MLEPEERAYCAGLFEGEGSISFTTGIPLLKSGERGNPYRGIQLRIEMTDREPLELFGNMMGMGTLAGPFPRNRKIPIYRYRVTGFEKVQYAICQLWFWLSPRRKEQISKALKSYTSHRLVRQHRVGRKNTP